MNKKLKLNKLTVTNLERVKGGTDPVCMCPEPTLGYDQVFYHNGGIPSVSLPITICWDTCGAC